MRLEGIVTPVITPFRKDEEIDEEKILKHLDFLIKYGIHGLFILGTNGEGPLLTLEEKKRVIKTSAEYINGRLPIIAGTGCVSTRETIELSKYAEQVGVTAVSVVTPYYYPVSQQGLIKHYTSIAESIEVPIIIYHIPDLTGNKMTLDTLRQLSEIENVVGMKDSSKDIIWFYNAVITVRKMRDDFAFFGGSDALIYTQLMLGGSGAVSAVSNVFPDIVVELYDEFKKGNYRKAKEIQDKVLRIRQALKNGPYMAGVKGALELRGMGFSKLRSPLRSLDEEELKRLEENLRKIGVL